MTTTIRGTDNSAAAPALTGNDPDTGVYFPAADTLGLVTGGSEAVRVDSSGDVGIGVTPEAWDTNFKALQIGATAALVYFPSSDQTVLYNNTYYSSGDKRLIDGSASYYSQGSGAHFWGIAGSGLADSAITFTQAMKLDSSGNLGIGTSTPSARLMSSVGSSGSGVVNALRLQNVGTTVGDGAGIVFTAGTSTVGAGIASTGVALDSADLRFYAGGNTERMRIDSSGNLGIGATSLIANAKLDVRGQAVFQGTTTPSYPGARVGVVNINNNSADGTVDFTQGIVFTDNSNNTGAWTHAGICTTGSTGFNGNLVFGTDGDGIQNITGIVERMRLTSDGYLRMASGTGGIQFGGDTAAANALDDYEEGTWTPTITSGGWSIASINRASYTKIGNRVWFQADFTLSGSGNSSDFRIGGLPFVVQTGGWSPGQCYFFKQNTDFWKTAALPSASGGQNFLFIQAVTTAGNGATLIGTDLGAGYVAVAAFYEVA